MERSFQKIRGTLRKGLKGDAGRSIVPTSGLWKKTGAYFLYPRRRIEDVRRGRQTHTSITCSAWDH